MLKEIQLPFKCEVLDHPETIANPYTGQKVELQPQAVAVYDSIKGAEMMASELLIDDGDHELWQTVSKGVAWFREHYPKEYMVLLD